MTAAPFYLPRSTKRNRRARADIDRVREAIYAILSGDNPMTVRQCFYALTVAGVIDKTEAEYKGTVIRLLTQMRRDGVIPYPWIADNTRWMRKPTTHIGLADALRETARFYRRDLWAGADCYVEVWCEKDALAGVIMQETETFDVPLMVSRGFSSDTYLESAARAIRVQSKPTFIYQLGDHDPSGLWIAKQIEVGLRRHAPEADIHFQRVAVTLEQIGQWTLPSRPTKREGNSHARDFEGDSVELDAIPAAMLRALVRGCIEQHIDQKQFEILKIAEASERELLTGWLGDGQVSPEQFIKLSEYARREELFGDQRRQDRNIALDELGGAAGRLGMLMDRLAMGGLGDPDLDFAELGEIHRVVVAAVAAIS